MRGICLLTGSVLTLALAGTAVAAALPDLPSDERAAPAAGETDAETAPVPAGEATEGAESAAGSAEAAGEPAPGAATLTTGQTEPTYPYRGKITADLVNIRCGPGLYYYPLTTLSKGDDVVVASETGRWLAIRMPESAFGLMRTSDLDIRPGGATATVTAPRARVYASGPSADRQWCVASILEKDALVTVRGPAEGEFVRVAPPEDARAYVVKEYVTASAAAAPDTAAQPAAGEGEVQPPETNPLIEAFHKADRDLEAEMRKEIGQREFDAPAAQYQAILEKAEKDYIQEACRQRLAYIEMHRESQENYLRVQSLPERLDERLADIKTRYAEDKAARDAEKQMGGSEFAAEGCVRKLASLAGVEHPIKYKLVDQNNRPLVVLKSTRYDLGEYLGKVIGVRGTRTYLKDWDIYCVTVDDLEVLEE